MGKEKITYAHWELAPEDTAYENVWVCSNCGEELIQHRKPKYRFCHNCGARMDEGENDENKNEMENVEQKTSDY